MVRPVVDPHLCIACGICVDLCPEVFQMDEEYAVVNEDVDYSHMDCCEEAAQACPTEAITLD